MIDDTLLEAEEKMDKAVSVAKEDFSNIRTGRVHPGIFAKVTAEYYGTQTPLNQLASFHVPEPRMVVVQPFDKNSLGAIEKAIRNSDLGVNPGNDGVIYDGARQRIIAANGAGANLVVFVQQDGDHYALEQVVGTRNMAKTLALDPATGDLYTITAEGIYDASRKNLAYIAPFYPNAFTPDSFRVLQYGR